MPTETEAPFADLIEAISSMLGYEVLVLVGSGSASGGIISVQGILRAESAEGEEGFRYVCYRLEDASGRGIGDFGIEESLLLDACIGEADGSSGLPSGVELNLAGTTFKLYPRQLSKASSNS